MSSPDSSQSGYANPQASSSRTPPSASPTQDEGSDGELELDQKELLAQDPLFGSPGTPKGRISSLTSRFLASPANRNRDGTPISSRNPSRTRRSATPNTILSYLNAAADPSAGLQDAKDAGSLDWYVEGPGRRVGYDNLTAIDWIYEYNKERTRQRQLNIHSSGLLGQLKILGDSSQIWWVLVATGVAVGSIAAGIDVASDWLGDLKTGLCSNVQDGGRFYLNRAFCCWQTNTYAECRDWRTWATAMGISNKGGSYVVEYVLFVLFSVSALYNAGSALADSSRSCSRVVQAYWSTGTPTSPDRAASLKSRRCSVALSSGTF